MNNGRINSSKSHYFIGTKLDDLSSKNLRSLQKWLKRVFKSPKTKYDYTFHSRFIYLGYLTDSTASKFIHYLNPYLQAISSSISNLCVKYTRVVVCSKKNSDYLDIAVEYENDILEKTVIPYLNDAVRPILRDFLNNNFIPVINLLSIPKKKFNYKYVKERLSTARLPKTNTFFINKIDVLKGTLKEIRVGQPSQYDEMLLDVSNNYPLQGN